MNNELITAEGDAISIVDDASVLATLNKSEIDQQIATAKAYPRSMRAFIDQATELATLDEDTAATMFFVLPRGGKQIEGPSIRLAEVVGMAYGNLRYGARIVSVGQKTVTAQGVCFDLEKNVSAAVEVERRITDKNGKRYKDDMIVMTSQAACSVALRNAIFRVVPRALVDPLFHKAKMASVGKAESMALKRQKVIDAFGKTGATEPQILEFLGVKGMEDVTLDHLVLLRGLYTAIKDGTTTIEQVLEGDKPSKQVQRSALNDSTLGGGAEPEGDTETPPPVDAEATPPKSKGVRESFALEMNALLDECSSDQDWEDVRKLGASKAQGKTETEWLDASIEYRSLPPDGDE